MVRPLRRLALLCGLAGMATPVNAQTCFQITNTSEGAAIVQGTLIHCQSWEWYPWANVCVFSARNVDTGVVATDTPVPVNDLLHAMDVLICPPVGKGRTRARGEARCDWYWLSNGKLNWIMTETRDFAILGG
jgi:hypothetical protein